MCYFHVSVSQYLFRYSGLLLRGLSHPSPRVQTLAVAQLARSAQDEDLAAQLVGVKLFLWRIPVD